MNFIFTFKNGDLKSSPNKPLSFYTKNPENAGNRNLRKSKGVRLKWNGNESKKEVKMAPNQTLSPLPKRR